MDQFVGARLNDEKHQDQEETGDVKLTRKPVVRATDLATVTKIRSEGHG